MGSANASPASAMTTPLCIALLVLLGVHHHATTTRQTDAIARLQASYARLQSSYAALAAACAEPRQHAHAPVKHGCGPFAGCVDRVAAAGDAVASRRRSKGAFATFGAASCMNGLFGMVLLPVLAHVPRPKILEIGLGCGMPDGPGESADVWHELFPRGLDLWVAEYDAPCVAAYETSPLKHNATRVLVGDQGDADDLRRWARDAGGAFDAVIDDGATGTRCSSRASASSGATCATAASTSWRT
ncbi:hypothetical protein JL721_4212 [Aureococcus anophagefferens]|nr:hypothetical protein JL721_4212 [Aureococcus anophagefferens]